MAPKSILKNSSSGDFLDSLTSSTSQTKEERNREVAIYHANIIQAQKDVENDILEALEALIEFPTTPDASSINPSPADVEAFRKYVTPFQPSDYDALLEERRIAEKCGHVFCNKAPKKSTSVGGKFKIVGKKRGQEFKVVEREKMDCWCSMECARRALYVKVQLNEEPAWSRRAGSSPEIRVLVGDEVVEPDESALSEKRLQENMEMLAIERGDQGKPARSKGMVKHVVEKDSVDKPDAPSQGDADTIEGYAPRALNLPIRTKPSGVKHELGDRDWDL